MTTVTVRSLLALTITICLTANVAAQSGRPGRGKPANQNRQRGAGEQNQGGRQQGAGPGAAMPGRANGVLSAAERNQLQLMREEEKLARDVYLALLQQGNAQVFANISQAESKHMQAIGNLLAKYQVPDPVAGNAPGVFTQPQYQQLYATLVQAGSQSPAASFQVGLKIEEMDIADLRSAMAQTANPDLLQVYQNLERGSRNHLRAFASQLKRVGGSYQPTHLSPAEFNQIANSPGGPGNGQGAGCGPGGHAGNGNGRGGNRGRGGQGPGNPQRRGNGGR